MINNYQIWRQRHPAAAAELEALLQCEGHPDAEVAAGKSEAWAQQQARFKAASRGWRAWRNNVGATPAVIETACPGCGLKHEIRRQPVRYGLCNDSDKLNKEFKSADLILCIPRLITPDMVGKMIGQFGSIECKRPGWTFNPNDPHEQAQANWANLVNALGGVACFSTGGLPE